MISSYQEALVLYSTCETERRELEFALQLTQAELQRASLKFQHARKGLTKAEFRTGKIRRMIKKSGFSDVLQQARMRLRHQPVVKLHRMLCLFLLFLMLLTILPQKMQYLELTSPSTLIEYSHTVVNLHCTCDLVVLPVRLWQHVFWKNTLAYCFFFFLNFRD